MTASTLTSDNGASSGTSGIKYNGGTDGTLQLQTTTSGGTATTAVTIDNSQNTTLAGYLNAPNTFGFKNRIINGAMGIWQRGTSSTTNNAYTTADRWYTENITSVAQSSDVPSGFTYSLSVTGTSYPGAVQRIEAANCADLVGQPVTISFWAKNSSGTAILYSELFYANAQNNFSGVTSITNVTLSSSPSGSWTKYTYTVSSLPSGAANGLELRLERDAASASTTLYTGVQLEKGSTATSFDYRSIGTELALCQRYYWRSTGASAGYPRIDGQSFTNTARFSCLISFPVSMRATPTVNLYGTWTVGGGGQPVVEGPSPEGMTFVQAGTGAGNMYAYPSGSSTYVDAAIEL